MNRILFLQLVVVLLFTACSGPEQEIPVWLEGDWTTGAEAGFSGEHWQVINDTLLKGQGLVLIGNTEHIMEEISIFSSMGSMYYSARVTEQNKGSTILFKARHIEDGHLVFTNPEHDFPTRIVYKLRDPDTLMINISGRDKEDSRTIKLFRND